MDYNKLILDSLPQEFLEDTIALLYRVYKASYFQTIENYPSNVSRNKVGYERWAMMERDWPLLARKHGLSVDEQPNANGGWYHVEVGNTRLVLTQSKVNHPRQRVQKAIYRNTLATESSQTDLFTVEFPVPMAAEPGGRYFVLLLHGPVRQRRDLPAFAHLVVPNADCTQILARVDLFKHCYTVAAKLADEGYEIIKPTAKPVIKKIAKEEGGAG